MTDIPFTDPFRYSPHPLVRKAALEVVERLDRMIAEGQLPEAVAKGFTEGKMLGVLICHSEEEDSSEIRVLHAFSGSVGGTSIVEGFVPPIFDLTEDGGHYRTHEAEISALNKEIERLRLEELQPLKKALDKAAEDREEELDKLRMLKKKASGTAESQFANGEIKRAKDRWKAVISDIETRILEISERLAGLKRDRAAMSDELQKWIFSRYMVHNAYGEEASVLEIFRNQGLMSPGGTGDCAAPKLLNHAYLNGLRPVAMGEFWYGKSPATAVRTHGHFYPSCTSKCGPLLGFMMEGLSAGSTEGTFPPPGRGCLNGRAKARGAFAASGLSQQVAVEAGVPGVHPYMDLHPSDPQIIYEDEEIIVAEKPSGMPSVPGLDGRQSLQEWICENRCPAVAVHRLDMDTSGIIVLAKNADAESSLKKQFEGHSVRKTYLARLSPADKSRYAAGIPELKAGDKGRIELPLAPDYDERPRQKADSAQGKESVTEYEVLCVNEDGTTDVIFHPLTGRTHQLRVHSAHVLGLGRPILGDLLYGGCGSIWTGTGSCTRLHLHASAITFRHPGKGTEITISSAAHKPL